MIKAQTITTGANHAIVQNLRGWSFRGATPVLRFRKDGIVTGDIIGTVEGDSHVIYPDAIDAQDGCYVELVSGTLTEGVLYYI